MHGLSGKVAVVTGAGSGLGRAIAGGLAQRGARVALVGRREGALAETARSLQTAGGTALVVPSDVSRAEAVDDLRSRVAAVLGPADILVNAAGVFGPIQQVVDSDSRRWIETIEINLLGPYLTCRAFLRGKDGMIQRGWGRIVNVSSAAAFHTPGTLNSAYGTSKVALNQFTRHLAAELADTGVTANVIHPGEAKTEMWAAIRDEAHSAGASAEGYRSWADDVRRTGGDDPQKAVDLVVRLVDESSATINGQFLWIEGGIQKPLPSW
jgi:NAD(P)-dependent dehydrogenase (short-subunit alcohol dehydrogenase family)